MLSKIIITIFIVCFAILIGLTAQILEDKNATDPTTLYDQMAKLKAAWLELYDAATEPIYKFIDKIIKRRK